MVLLKGFLYSSIFAAMCAVGLCIATEKLLLGTLPPFVSPLHVFVFANTLSIYNIHYFVKNLPPGVSDRADWSKRHRHLHLTLIALAMLASLVCLFFLNLKVIGTSIVLGILSLAYSLPLLPFPEKKRLKDFGILKLFLLSVVWSSVTVLMPMFFWGRHFEDYQVEFLLRFCFMVPLCAAFDIRDMETDKSRRIFTLPNAIGISKTRKLIDFFLVLFCLLALWQYFRYPNLARLTAAFLIAMLTKWSIGYASKRKTDIAYLLFVDGMMFLYALLIWLAH